MISDLNFVRIPSFILHKTTFQMQVFNLSWRRADHRPFLERYIADKTFFSSCIFNTFPRLQLHTLCSREAKLRADTETPYFCRRNFVRSKYPKQNLYGECYDLRKMNVLGRRIFHNKISVLSLSVTDGVRTQIRRGLCGRGLHWAGSRESFLSSF
jgi:hypothetical protein